jgi:short-subunit dehydrogenase
MPDSRRPSDFRARYGRWAAIAGGSEGLGAAFADALARRGLNLVLLADGAASLKATADKLASSYAVQVRRIECDLGDATFAGELARQSSDIEIGLGVYNAAYSFVAKLFERPLEDSLRVLDVNCAGPLRFAHAIVPPMIARGRGGLVLVSSLAGAQGTPRLSAYAASKAFNIVLGESLWAELAPSGVDVLVSCPGAIRTSRYRAVSKREAPGALDAEVVAGRTLDALGRGPRYVPGGINKLSSFLLGRILSRSAAIAVMGRSTERLE